MDWKKIGKKLLFPPIWLMVLLSIASAVLLTFVFVRGWEQQVIAYFVYVLAFYTLSVVTVFCVMVLPKQYGKIKKKILANPLGNRYATDKVFRTKVSLNLSLTRIIVSLYHKTWKSVNGFLQESDPALRKE